MVQRKSGRAAVVHDAERNEVEPRQEAEGRGDRPKAPTSRAAVPSEVVDPRVERPKRRRLSAERKLQIFIECSIPGAPVGEVLRRDGLYTSDLARIREQVREGALEKLKQGPGRKRRSPAEREAARLLEELQRKEKALIDVMMENLALKKDESRASKGR